MKKFYTYIFITLFSVTISYAEIPVILISAGKAIQSKGTVGSDVTVIDRKIIENSNHLYVGDLLDEEILGSNFGRNSHCNQYPSRVRR